MREYRGKSVLSVEELNDKEIPHENGWVHGWYVNGWIVGNYADSDDAWIAFEWWSQVIPETVGQYTGLKDKNGVEIYEGDVVVRTKYRKEPYVIQFRTSENIGCNGGEYDYRITGFMPVKTNGKVDEMGDCEYMYSLFVKESNDLEVIGNMHDKGE